MKKMIIAEKEHIDDIVKLRVEMQIEDWENTLHEDFSVYADQFGNITKEYLLNKLGDTIYFAVMYLDNELIAICAIEELSELPQISVCKNPKGRHCCVASVYTKPQFRGKGYQQELFRFLMNYAKDNDFSDITLTTNTPDAAHIYEKIGFEKISSKYYLGF